MNKGTIAALIVLLSVGQNSALFSNEIPTVEQAAVQAVAVINAAVAKIDAVTKGLSQETALVEEENVVVDSVEAA